MQSLETELDSEPDYEDEEDMCPPEGHLKGVKVESEFTALDEEPADTT